MKEYTVYLRQKFVGGAAAVIKAKNADEARIKAKKKFETKYCDVIRIEAGNAIGGKDSI